MPSLKCPLTGKHLPAGFIVHPSCAARIVRIAQGVEEVMPAVVAVQRGEARPGPRPTGGGQPRSRVPLNVGVFEDVDDIRDVVYTWAALVLSEVAHRPGVDVYRLEWSSVARVFASYSLELCRWREVPVMVDELEDALAWACRITDPPARTLPVMCPACLGLSYQDLQKQFVQCPHCMAGFPLDRARLEMLRVAYARPLPMGLLVEALAAFGYEVSAKRIQKWKERGKISPVFTHPDRYRPQDVVALLERSPAS